MSTLLKIGAIAFFILVVFLQCSTPNSTMLAENWTDNNYPATGFQNILVVGIARRPEVRSSFENELKSQLKSKNVKVVASSDVMPMDEKIDVETFHNYFDDKNIDTVITTQLISVDELPSSANSGKSQQLNAASFYEYYDVTVWEPSSGRDRQTKSDFKSRNQYLRNEGGKESLEWYFKSFSAG